MHPLAVLQCKLVFLSCSDQLTAVYRGNRVVFACGLGSDLYDGHRVSLLDGLSREIQKETVDFPAESRAEGRNGRFGFFDTANGGDILRQGFSSDFGGLDADLCLFVGWQLSGY